MLSSRPISVHMDQNPGAMAFKTPRRAQHRAENATTGRNLQAFQMPFKQPFGDSTTTAHPGKDVGGTQAGGKMAPRTVVRVLGDKTPFPNRARKSGGGGAQTPIAFAKIGLDPLPALDTPGLRPSSSRKSVRRSRGSGGGGGFDLALTGIHGLNLGAAFQTPKVNGNPWDVEDVDVAVPTMEEAIEEEAAPDYDEIEYMPPKAEGE
jgi:hypothetical protein